ncbi:MAG: CDP-alcohol phosphatidyltransferase family protein [Patescibacteria group bacterium]|nr:CDP-alcohol phosphatidyltransferase family protein [Patescibacteria group bacterium]
MPHDKIYRCVLDPLIPKSVRPNHVTVIRIFMVPFVIYFLYIGNYAVGVPLFLFASLTDALDGSMARVRKQITRWGILYDPLADKMLIGAVLFLIVLQHVNFYLGLALIMVEVIMIVGAWIRSRRGLVEPANFWGKLKMFVEVVGISLLLVALWLDISLLVDLSVGTLAVALAVAIVSIMSRLHT